MGTEEEEDGGEVEEDLVTGEVEEDSEEEEVRVSSVVTIMSSVLSQYAHQV